MSPSFGFYPFNTGSLKIASGINDINRAKTASLFAPKGLKAWPLFVIPLPVCVRVDVSGIQACYSAEDSGYWIKSGKTVESVASS